jgi:hypothetical protein
MNGSTNMSALHMEYTVCTCTAAIVQYIPTSRDVSLLEENPQFTIMSNTYVILIL